MARKYARRFPRITPPTPAAPTQSNTQAKENYDKSLWRDLWELFKRVAALEAGSGGPGGAVVSITATLPLVNTPNPITGTGTSTINTFTGDSGSGGLRGVVPAPAAGDAAANKFLKADATWHTVSGLASPLTTKGDVWGYSSVDARIPIGSDGQVLTADSAQTLGLKWATPAGAAGSSFFWALVLGGN